jgi:hypothetical protein
MTVPLIFGVFPLGMAGGPDGLAVGAPDDFEAIGRALGELQGDGSPLLPRMYVVWSGPESTATVSAQVAQLAGIPVAQHQIQRHADRRAAGSGAVLPGSRR